jgi:superfamily II DNA or RNA helicase/HKD family nuclease
MSSASDSAEVLPDGVYDSLFTSELAKRLEVLGENSVFQHNESEVSISDLPRALFTHLMHLIRAEIESLDKSEQQIQFTNDLISFLKKPELEIDKSARTLTGVVNNMHDGTSKISRLPQIPLSEIYLLTNNKGEPSLGSEIRAELQSADSVDIVMSFVMKQGVILLEDSLRDFAERGGKIRLITTTYTGNSDADAVIRFAKEFGAEVKISYESRKDRLHAKSWIFYRDSGFSTAYVGSSNISAPALSSGSEWNLKVSSVTNPELFKKFTTSFEFMWNQSHFTQFLPGQDDDKLRDALKAAQFGVGKGENQAFFPFMNWEPYPHQKRMLEDLDIQRSINDRHFNLIVAATGTGKTMLAAFDYKRQLSSENLRPRLLFVAHKKEILNQALGTFRAILNDQSFGELLVDGNKPSEWKHVFASVQSLNLKDLSQISSDHFDYIVVDEFHHAEAKSYKTLLDYFKPRELLALTATPERTDLKNVQDTYFDGVISSELRLWDAADEGLLSPFTYYVISDGTDLTSIKWAKGAYVAADLANVYTSNDARNIIVYNSVVKYLAHPSSARILAFCASKLHADHTAEFFSSKGIRAVSVTSDTPQQVRDKAVSDLGNGKIQMICAVDIFNEGVDIPAIDTLLFLRPTESPLIFLQQFGRGLRKSNDKERLTVLDFVGVHRAEYRFDKKLKALALESSLSVERAIELDQWNLPSGCQIVFDKMAKDIILKNIRQQVKSQFNLLVEDLKIRGNITLNKFLNENELLISDIYANNKTWSMIRQAAGFIEVEFPDNLRGLSRNLKSFSYACDPARNHFYVQLVENKAGTFETRSRSEQILTAMFFWNLFPSGRDELGNKFATYDDGISHFNAISYLREELRQVLEVAAGNLHDLPNPIAGALSHLPLSTHSFYTREELLAAFDYARLSGHFLYSEDGDSRAAQGHPSGVHHAENLKSDLFLVTLNKDASNFSPSVMYKDYAISSHLFHWESQNSVASNGVTAGRYINHSENNHNLILCIRQNLVNELGTAPFQLIGSTEVQSHSGSKPLQLTLRVNRELPLNVVEASPANTAL